jgi:hypothetical protein
MLQYGLIVTDHGGAVVSYAQDQRPCEAADGGVKSYPALEGPGQPAATSRTAIRPHPDPIDQLHALPPN